MKKIYSLAIVLGATLTFSAQTVLLSEDFAAYTSGGNTATTGAGVSPDGTDIYSPGSTVLPAGVPSANFPAGSKVYQAGGMAKLGTSSLVGTMTTKTLNLSTDGGNFKVTFDVKGWTSVEGTVSVSVSAGPAAQSATYTAIITGALETKTLTFSGGLAGSTITIATSAKRAFIDNVKVETMPTLGTIDLSKSRNFVKNTIVENELVFGKKISAKIVNSNGQVVKSINADENSILDVSSLPKGVYVVTGEINGDKISQKIIKK